jgi:hypothetical protein
MALGRRASCRERSSLRMTREVDVGQGMLMLRNLNVMHALWSSLHVLYSGPAQRELTRRWSFKFKGRGLGLASSWSAQLFQSHRITNLVNGIDECSMPILERIKGFLLQPSHPWGWRLRSQWEILETCQPRNRLVLTISSTDIVNC